jgi:hypothetical protein
MPEPHVYANLRHRSWKRGQIPHLGCEECLAASTLVPRANPGEAKTGESARL